MVDEHYELYPSKEEHLFYFVSEGSRGRILKLIHFTPTRYKRWNLAFGDYRNGYLDDQVVSNNDDLQKIMKTIIQAAYDFCEIYPERSIEIVPVDEKRKTLYNAIVRRNFETFSKSFVIKGEKGKRLFAYNPKENYDAFVFRRKKR